MARAGSISITVDRGGYPVWCRISHDHFEGVVINLHHSELTDLKYAVEKAMQEAILALPESQKHRDEVLLP